MAILTATHDAPLPADWEGYWTDYTLLKRRSLSPRTLSAYRDSFVYLGRFLAPHVPTWPTSTAARWPPISTTRRAR